MIKLVYLGVLFPVCAFATLIPVFTDAHHPIADLYHQASICTIVNSEAIIARINREIQQMPVIDKEAIAKTYVNDFKRIEASKICLHKAHELGVTKLPTMVIGNQLIVGITDVPTAISHYEDKAP